MEDIKKLAISFLAYGEEHIEELNNLLNKLGKYKNEINFYITTDTEFNLYNCNKISLPFNYNLKRFPIREAFINNDVVLFIDTDHVLKKEDLDLSFIDEIEDGIYINWVDTVDGIKYENRISLNDFLNHRVLTGVNIDYFEKINDLNYNKKELFFIRESFFLIKLTDENKKLEFINTWNDLVNKIDFNNLTNNQIGIMEGLIIYLTCLLNKINIFEINENKKLLKIYNNFIHLGDHNSIHILDKKLF